MPQNFEAFSVRQCCKLRDIFYDQWKIYLTCDQYIIPENLRSLHCGGCLITIMKTSNDATKNGLSKSTVSFVLSLERLSGIIWPAATWRMALPGCAVVIAARNICLPLAAKAGGFAHHATRKRLSSSETSYMRQSSILSHTGTMSSAFPLCYASILNMTELCWQNCAAVHTIACLFSYKTF